jgi:fibronectin type 3 domain-containing protein
VEKHMNRRLRGTIVVLGGLAVFASAHVAHAAGLAVPTEVEARAISGGKMSISWNQAAGATSYNVYRSTTSGGEGTTPLGSTTSTSYMDAGLTSGPVTRYYYKVAAVNGSAVSPQSAETASPTPPRTSPGSGTVAGIAQNGGLLF